MADPDLYVPGNDAPAGPADAPTGALSGDTGTTVPRAVRATGKVVMAAAAGTTVNPLDRDNYAVATNAGYGTAMGRGLELAITLLVCCGIGLGIDHVAGTSPLFTIIFSVVGFAGIGVKLKLGYDLEMDAHEKDAIWNRGKTVANSKGEPA